MSEAGAFTEHAYMFDDVSPPMRIGSKLFALTDNVGDITVTAVRRCNFQFRSAFLLGSARASTIASSLRGADLELLTRVDIALLSSIGEINRRKTAQSHGNNNSYRSELHSIRFFCEKGNLCH